ncbi:hypothetical protein COMA2_120062 [Candidatus Nitrospira nitrificans]|uniref:Uncharacterized protein n=1 Tax=Candidatus Nitrospira nitrificans TaxID=1742973 RepID=A0A0S4L787_9BACT|nr:hypothetical protein COMA2_120062 [Candidatus Nitrospira nitrificans]
MGADVSARRERGFLDQVPGRLYGKEVYAAHSYNNEVALGNQHYDRLRYVLVALVCGANWRGILNDRAGNLQCDSIFERRHDHGGGNGAVGIPASGK